MWVMRCVAQTVIKQDIVTVVRLMSSFLLLFNFAIIYALYLFSSHFTSAFCLFSCAISLSPCLGKSQLYDFFFYFLRVPSHQQGQRKFNIGTCVSCMVMAEVKVVFSQSRTFCTIMFFLLHPMLSHHNNIHSETSVYHKTLLTRNTLPPCPKRIQINNVK